MQAGHRRPPSHRQCAPRCRRQPSARATKKVENNPMQSNAYGGLAKRNPPLRLDGRKWWITGLGSHMACRRPAFVCHRGSAGRHGGRPTRRVIAAHGHPDRRVLANLARQASQPQSVPPQTAARRLWPSCGSRRAGLRDHPWQFMRRYLLGAHAASVRYKRRGTLAADGHDNVARFARAHPSADSRAMGRRLATPAGSAQLYQAACAARCLTWRPGLLALRRENSCDRVQAHHLHQ